MPSFYILSDLRPLNFGLQPSAAIHPSTTTVAQFPQDTLPGGIMLTVQDSGLLFQFLSYCSSLNIFPFHVDQKRGTLREFKGRKYLTWNLVFMLQSLHYMHGLIQFILLLTTRRDKIVLYHLPAQFDGMIVPLLLYPPIIFVFKGQGGTLVKVFHELYDCDVDGPTTRRPLWKLSLNEVLALGFCMVTPAAAVVYGGMVIILPDMAHLLINNPILLSWKSSIAAVMTATLFEVWVLAIWAINAGIFMSLNCLLLSKVEFTLIRISALLSR